MENKIKVENCMSGCAVYLNCEGLSKDGRTIKIPAKDKDTNELPYLFISEDELNWVMANSKMFKEGHVRVVDEGNLSPSTKEKLPKEVFTELDIPSILKLSPAAFTKKIQGVDRLDLLKTMKDMANEAGSSVKIVDAIEARIGKILPSFNFEPVVDK